MEELENIKCISCGKELDKFDGRGHVGVFNGMVQVATINYGSKHDGSVIETAVCDECISEGLLSGSVVWRGSKTLL